MTFAQPGAAADDAVHIPDLDRFDSAVALGNAEGRTPASRCNEYILSRDKAVVLPAFLVDCTVAGLAVE